MSLFDKLKQIQNDKETPETPETPELVSAEDVAQCECGGTLAGACPECDNIDTGPAPKIIGRLQKVGDAHAVNPPRVEMPEKMMEDIENACQEKKAQLAAGAEPVEELTETAQAPKPSGKECPYCKKVFARLGAHRCAKQPEGAASPLGRRSELDGLVPGATSTGPKIPTTESPEETKAIEAPPALNPTDQMDPIHEDELVVVSVEIFKDGVLVEDDPRFEVSKSEVKLKDEAPNPGESTTKPREVQYQGVDVRVMGPITGTTHTVSETTEEVPGIYESPEGFDLYVDCCIYLTSKTEDKAMYFADIIGLLAAKLEAEHKVPTWKAIPYGAGPGYLAKALDGWLIEQEPGGMLMMLSGSPEYAACLDVMMCRARTVIMGVR